MIVGSLASVFEIFFIICLTFPFFFFLVIGRSKGCLANDRNIA